MKEFEKQWECGMLSGSPSSFNSGASTKEAAQFIWRAGLEWVKVEIIECLSPQDALELIEDELNEN